MASTKCGFDDVPGGASGRDLLAIYGPTLLVDIGFDPTYQQTQKVPPAPGMKSVRALVDTGAAESCIDSVLAAQLNLPIVDKRLISVAGGTHEVNMHLAQVAVPSLGVTIYGAFAGVHLAAGGQTHSL